ncbi:MAG: hypothetical protein AB7I32_10495 [Gammaproteobacteria bacterium]
MKHAFPFFSRALLASLVLLLVAGCKEETTRPTYSDQAQSRIRAVEQAEMKRAAQQKQGEKDQPPPSAAPAAGGAAAASGGQAPAAQPQATPGAVAPQPYLPPSERGAYVEITETPAGSPPPPAGAQQETAAGAAAAAPGGPPPAGGGTGGNMPAAVAPNPPAGAPLPPPAPPTGGLTPGGDMPRMQGPSALSAPAGAGPAEAANAELERKLREFDALMKRAQAEAERERAAGGGARGGRIDGLGGAPEDIGGAGGAASRATGSGASPDLSGEASAAGLRRGGPSAVRIPIDEDDDIVARQLREAAERETDPVLQEKLWDEYRKYKAP